MYLLFAGASNQYWKEKFQFIYKKFQNQTFQYKQICDGVSNSEFRRMMNSGCLIHTGTLNKIYQWRLHPDIIDKITGYRYHKKTKKPRRTWY